MGMGRRAKSREWKVESRAGEQGDLQFTIYYCVIFGPRWFLLEPRRGGFEVINTAHKK
jgi:hypothetical protein